VSDELSLVVELDDVVLAVDVVSLPEDLVAAAFCRWAARRCSMAATCAEDTLVLDTDVIVKDSFAGFGLRSICIPPLTISLSL